MSVFGARVSEVIEALTTVYLDLIRERSGKSLSKEQLLELYIISSVDPETGTSRWEILTGLDKDQQVIPTKPLQVLAALDQDRQACQDTDDEDDQNTDDPDDDPDTDDDE